MEGRRSIQILACRALLSETHSTPSVLPLHHRNRMHNQRRHTTVNKLSRHQKASSIRTVNIQTDRKEKPKGWKTKSAAFRMEAEGVSAAQHQEMIQSVWIFQVQRVFVCVI